MNKSKVYLTSTGCFTVQTETNHIAAYLKSNGYELVDTVEKAEAIIVTTCGVTDESAKGTQKEILDCIRKRGDNVPIYVAGCFVRIEKTRMKELTEYGAIFPVPDINGIENEFIGSNPWTSITYNNFFSHPFSTQYLQQVNAEAPIKLKIIKKSIGLIDRLFKKQLLFDFLFTVGHLYNPEVQRDIWPVIASRGCTHACTYCAVRIGRGKYTSKPQSSVMHEIRMGIEQGYKRILLIGDELGPYGSDLKDGTSLSTLLDSLTSEEFAISIGLWYIDAFLLMEALPALERLAEKNKLFFLGITIQHGSNRILELMNRHYSLADTMDAIQNFKKFPNIIIATQFMVGFPTETEEDFSETLALVNKGFFDKVEVFEYSPRPRTLAAKMTDDVPPQVKKERGNRLRKLAFKKSQSLFLKHAISQFGDKT